MPQPTSMLTLSLRPLVWVGSILLQCLLTLLLAACLLLGTDRGTQLLLDSAAQLIDLEYQELNGNVFQQLSLAGLTMQTQNLDLQIEQLEWELQLADLWLPASERKLTINRLVMQGVSLHIAATESAAADSTPATELPELSELSLPFGFALNQLQISRLQINQDQQAWQLQQLDGHMAINTRGASQLAIKIENGPFASHADLQLRSHWSAALAEATLQIRQASAKVQAQDIGATGQLQLSWDGQQLHFAAEQFRLRYGDASANINGAFKPQQRLTITADIPDLSIANTGLSGQASLQWVLHDASRSELSVTAPALSWLGQPLLTELSLQSDGTLAQQELTASAKFNALGTSAVALRSQFGWRDSLPQLQQAITLPPQQLLAAEPLHFASQLELPNADIASTGMQTRDNQITINLSPADKLVINGKSRSGEGELNLLGELTLLNDGNLNVAAELVGKQYQLANTAELKLSASPALNTTLASDLLTVRGEIVIDSGSIQLVAPAPSAIQPSADVYIVEDSNAANSQAGLRRDIAIRLTLASPIQLEGQGFKGTASGQLNIVEQTGQLPRASGELVLAGQYQAYGQDLTIRRGKLIYVDSPLDNPGVDLEAIRTVQDQVAGVRVSGLASQSNIQIFAEPALSETEALAYLVLGRGLDDSNEADANRLRSLALSLGLAGSGKLLKKYKDKLGVDELSLQTGDETQDTNLLIGRQLSDKLYISTQIGLFEPLAKLYLRYSLSRRCYLLSETGLQQAVDLVCTFEQQ